ncbi:MAG: ATP-dependent DNA helicase RecG [Chloroflexi bacterium]|nr:ATP-dependent DNA helicase RecG [Chloroflexota bacterium]
MSVSTESLRKILELEQKKGYLDSSVIGGLDKFLRYWSVQSAELVTSPHLLELAQSNYAAMTRAERKKWMQDLLQVLNGLSEKPEVAVKTASTTVPKAATPKKQLAGHTLDSPITVVKGISASLAAKFDKLGVKTIRDLLYFFPHRHLDYTKRKTISQLVAEEEQTIIANVWEARVSMPGGRRSTEATLGDETGNVRAVWFNQPYLVQRLRTNSQIVVSGKVSTFNERFVFESPEWELIENADELIHTGRLVPVYPLTSGLYPRQVRKLLKQVVDQWAGQVEDFLPASLRKERPLLELPQAISQAHYPDDNELKDKARIRLAFDELFLLQLGVLGRKRDWQRDQPGNPFNVDLPVLNKFIESLPFELTSAQSRVLKEILTDLEKSVPMSRLLQGEVGSGKTVIATVTLLTAVANGYQGAFMAPTEILAEQHFRTISALLAKTCVTEESDDFLHCYAGLLPEPITIALLIGDIRGSKKRELQQLVKTGKIDIVIGTHALIQKDIRFRKLGLAVVDEQHRFGVNQRAALRQKGTNPHILVMTATPIPRTLALTLYGDLDLSVIDQLPPGRQTVKTKWLRPEQRDSAYTFVRRQISSGRQAFIICPLVEESEAIQARAAIAEHESLSKGVFPDLRLGLLHGRMSAAEKDAVMRQFHDKALDILVSTAVVEVGIDVPNATVMLVEGADRFGLSQLHQFRGRVGRGSEQSYCLLLSENPSPEGQERLKLIENIQDGFQLAEQDLKLRGPGEFFGTRQSGLPDLRMAKLSDVTLLEMARAEATELFQTDPELEKPDHRLLAKEFARVWHQASEQS